MIEKLLENKMYFRKNLEQLYIVNLLFYSFICVNFENLGLKKLI